MEKTKKFREAFCFELGELVGGCECNKVVYLMSYLNKPIFDLKISIKVDDFGVERMNDN